jgi:anti-sigma factor RsiW
MTMHYSADILDDYLSGELEPEHDAAVHTHLETCPDCRALHEQAAAVRDWMRMAAKAEERDFPASIKARVWTEIRSTPSPLARLRTFWRPVLAVPVGAAIAAGLAFGYFAQHPAAPLRVAATYYLHAHNVQAAANPLADRSTSAAATVLAADPSATLPLVEAADVTSGDSGSATNP